MMFGTRMSRLEYECWVKKMLRREFRVTEKRTDKLYRKLFGRGRRIDEWSSFELEDFISGIIAATTAEWYSKSLSTEGLDTVARAVVHAKDLQEETSR